MIETIIGFILEYGIWIIAILFGLAVLYVLICIIFFIIYAITVLKDWSDTDV